MRLVTGGFPVVALLICASAWAAPEAKESPAPVVRYHDDKVSVDLHDAALDAVLKTLATESGAELVGTPRAERPVTMTFADVPLKEALERLVGAQNFTIKYDDAGKLKAIELRGGPEAPRARKPEAPSPAEGNSTPPKWYAFYKAFDRPGTVPLSGDLKKALGKDEAGWDYLGNAAIGHSDPRVRAEALHAIAKALDQDPEMKAAVMDSLNAMTDEELAAFARKTMHYRAEDVVRNVLRETSDRELRVRAREVLRELRKDPYKGPHFEMH